MVQKAYAALTRVVVASNLPEASWYSAAEAALTAIYALHPSPEHLSAAALRHLAKAAFAVSPDGRPAGAAQPASSEQSGQAESGEEGEEEAAPMEAEGPAAEAAESGEGGASEEGEEPAASLHTQQQEGGPRSMHSVVPLSRFFFALGHVALQHLVRRGRGRSRLGGQHLLPQHLSALPAHCQSSFLTALPSLPLPSPLSAGLHRARRQGGAPDARGPREARRRGARRAHGGRPHAGCVRRRLLAELSR